MHKQLLEKIDKYSNPTHLCNATRRRACPRAVALMRTRKNLPQDYLPAPSVIQSTPSTPPKNTLTVFTLVTKKFSFEAACHFMGNERDAGADHLADVSSRKYRIFTFFLEL
jgi:hypothetical protein